MKWMYLAIAVVVGAFCALTLMAIGLGGRDVPDAGAAQEAARKWTGWHETDPPRRRAGGWEVDVRRPDGSIVEVNLGRELELVELDEEVGPGGVPAHDELTGERRLQAVAAARPRAGAGVVRSVERELDGTIEVDFVLPDRTVMEVDLDAGLRITGADREELGDE